MKTQDEKIQKLKELGCAHEVSLFYDYVPDLEDISEDQKPEFSFNDSLLDVICHKYNGYSCDDIERKILMIISHL